jgi:hypothetical protein
MKSHRLTTTVTLLVLAVSASTPPAADAGSLLSGYGGPGQGSQAILGSALLKGPSGGGGSGGGSSPLSAGGGEAAAGTRASTTPASDANAPASIGGGRQKQANGSAGRASGGGFRAYTHTSGLTASRVSVGGSQTLGLSGADLLYIFLALGALVLTAVLTRRLARQPGWGRSAG